MPVAPRCACALLLLLCACGGNARDEGVPPRADSTVDSAVAVQPDLPSLSGDSTRKLLPLDESAQDTSFARFRTQLLQAIQRRDTTFLYSVLAAEIKNGFGGDDSIAGFRRLWRPDSADTQVWHVLEYILRLGTVRWGDGFSAPYVFSKWPQNVDAFDYVTVVKDRAVVRAQPSDTAKALGTLSYDVVHVKEWKDLAGDNALMPGKWANIDLPKGGTGWIQASDVYMPVSYRAYFEKRDGQWKITYFLAGD